MARFSLILLATGTVVAMNPLSYLLPGLHRFLPCIVFLALGLLPAGGRALAQDAEETGYRVPDPVLAGLVDAPQTPAVSLSPDHAYMLLMEQPALPSIAELAEPELRLAGLRINPRTNGPTRTRPYTGLTLRALHGETTVPVEGLPEGARIRNVEWAPNGQFIAFTVDLPDRINLYVADVAAAWARKLTERAVNDAVYGAPFAWMPDSRALVVRTVPAGRGAPPEASSVPGGPVIQSNTGEAAPARTYQDLLEDEHGAALFAYYAEAELVRIPLEGPEAPIGEAGLYTTARPSPDGAYLLTERLHEPFSYLVPAYRFPTRIEVLDRDGNPVREIADLPLAEDVPVAFGSVRKGVRDIGWRADAPATLAWVEALDEGDAGLEAEARDRVYLLDVTEEGAPTPLITLPLRLDEITWGTDRLALVSESWFATRRERVYAVDPAQPDAEPRVLFDYSSDDRYNDPGRPALTATGQGTEVLLTADDGTVLFFLGEGASPDGDRPFLRKVDLERDTMDELFRSEAPYYETPVALLDPGAPALVTRRESVTEPPNYLLRDLSAGTMTALTDFPHPYPELMDIQKEFIVYERADGVQLTATLYLPAGYEAQRDGPLPALVWAYPREFKDADAAGQVSGSPHRFNQLSYWGAVPYVTRGYAVLDGASMPIVGEGEAEPNDSFREQLVLNAEAVIEEGVRRGVVDPDRMAIGGHSYGAFMTANLLAHSDLFRAGIARSGAYNRTLTPFGFQREERTYWEAPEIYYQMSPFMHAAAIDEPILLIHGAADNNSGTFPIQSERFYHALKGHGKTARLVMLPYESHGYRARESLLHMLWETDQWLETYVKQASPIVKDPATSDEEMQ